MAGFLLIAPTGSGKTWHCENDTFFKNHVTDGDPLADYPSKEVRKEEERKNGKFDWTAPDRQNIDKVLHYMRENRRCVCWYVGTTAIKDALEDDRLRLDEIAIVVPPEQQHRKQVDERQKKDHLWPDAIVHRTLCEDLIREHKITHFGSFSEAVEFLRSRITNTQ